MDNKDDIQLTDEEIERVNKIIVGIQTDLKYAIEKLKTGDFEGALKAVNEGITKSNCPLCKRELGILIADIVHNKEICILKADTCEEEQKLVVDKAVELKEDFIPVIQTKKALKDKKKELEGTKETIKEIPTLDIRKLLPPLPTDFTPKWFYNKK